MITIEKKTLDVFYEKIKDLIIENDKLWRHARHLEQIIDSCTVGDCNCHHCDDKECDSKERSDDD